MTYCRVLVCLLSIVFAGARAEALDLRLTPVVTGLAEPLYVTHAGDDSGRLFVVERGGLVRIARNGVLNATAFLDARALIRTNGTEQGLLGLAFAPDYAVSGRFYVNYTDIDGDTVIARYRVSSNPDAADPASRQTMLAYDQPFENHNGGWLGFGPDGFLYIASGDGGSSNDPMGNGQNLGSLLGKLLRLDVSGDTAQIAPGNPFRLTGGVRGEIWAYGLRNPWRPSFDRSTGELWIGDVGQGRTEEIDLQPAGSAGGENYGWSIMEGSGCRVAGCTPIGVLPVNEYGHDLGCSVTGGYVYRGSAYPGMVGRYVFADFCSGMIWSLQRSGSGSSAANFTRALELDTNLSISSFGEDEVGNLYLVDYDGRVLLVSDGAPVATQIDKNYTGSWYDPAQSGHGFFIEVLPNNQLVAWWFTFGPDGQQSWFGGIGNIVGDHVTISAVRTTGGRFVPNFNPANVTNQPFGSMTLTFTSCSSGRVDFSFPDGYGTGTMQLRRLTVPDGVACTP
jgi:glucose/arabinose dehydrogenase